MLASIRTASAVPTPFCLMKMISEVAKAPIATANRSAAAVTIRPGALESDRDRLGVGGAVVAGLLDPREEEDRVVGREPEGDGEEQDRHRLLDRAAARSSRAGLRIDRPGRSGRGGRRRRSRLSTFMISDLIGSITDPVIRKRITRVATTMIPKAIGRWRAQARLEVDEVRGRPTDEDGRPRRRLDVADPVRRSPCSVAELNGFEETARITVTPSPSCCGGETAATPSVWPIRAATRHRRVRRDALDRDPDRRFPVRREIR